jgi:hypothetical protein
MGNTKILEELKTMNTNAEWLPPEGGLWRQWLWKLQILVDLLNNLLGLVKTNFIFIFRYGVLSSIGCLSVFMVLYPPYRFISSLNHGTILISYHLFMMFIAGLLGLRMVYVSKRS